MVVREIWTLYWVKAALIITVHSRTPVLITSISENNRRQLKTHGKASIKALCSAAFTLTAVETIVSSSFSPQKRRKQPADGEFFCRCFSFSFWAPEKLQEREIRTVHFQNKMIFMLFLMQLVISISRILNWQVIRNSALAGMYKLIDLSLPLVTDPNQLNACY